MIERLRLKAKRSFKFPCSLDPQEIPDISASWKADEKLHPNNVTENIFYKYCSVKLQGNMGQQVKALQMLQSRKIVLVLSTGCNRFQIREGYDYEIIWYTITFCCYMVSWSTTKKISLQLSCGC